MKNQWAKFMADKERADIKKVTGEANGPLVREIEDRALELTAQAADKVIGGMKDEIHLTNRLRKVLQPFTQRCDSRLAWTAAANETDFAQLWTARTKGDFFAEDGSTPFQITILRRSRRGYFTDLFDVEYKAYRNLNKSIQSARRS